MSKKPEKPITLQRTATATSAINNFVGYIHLYLQNKMPVALRASATQQAGCILSGNRLLAQTIY